MHRIKRVSAGLLEEKMKEAHSAPGDFETKKDIMSILVRARMAEEKANEGKRVGYAMSDGEMMDQVVSVGQRIWSDVSFPSSRER